MPTSPHIDFKFKNNNVLQTTPMLGVSCVLARTTNGPYDDPSEIISTFSQFQRIYGSEIVPDGSVSNIEKALQGGSKLRVIRVLGKDAYHGAVQLAIAEKTVAKSEEEGIAPASATPHPNTPPVLMTIASGRVIYRLGFITKGYGDPIGTTDIFHVGFYKQSNTLYYKIYSGNDQVLEQGPVITYKTADDNNNTSVDYLTLSAFAKNSKYIKPVVIDPVVIDPIFDYDPPFDDLIKWLADCVDGTKNDVTVTVGGEIPSDTEILFPGIIGSAGLPPTAEEWIASLDLVRDYTDFYQLFISHISQHLRTDADILKVYKAAADMAKELMEWVLYIEVPKHLTHYTQGTQARDYRAQVTWVQTCLGTVGNSKYIAYFGGGLKYYNEKGNLQDSDVLGTIVGLGDASATQYGPWKSFAGMNRGVIGDAVGPVCPNYGSPSRYNELNTLAQNYINEMVIKDTPDAGKQTMLWHCFSSQVKQDSERFLSIVRLNLYLKKFLRPVLNKYIEEPNVWSTWKRIWLEVKPTLDSLVDEDAMTEYTWMGDQDATSWDDLSVNNEADARQGKYHAILKYKDVVPMQEVTMEIVIDAASKAVSIVETSNNL